MPDLFPISVYIPFCSGTGFLCFVLQVLTMESKEHTAQGRSLAHVAAHFLIGVALGCIPLVIGILYWIFLGDSINWGTADSKFFVALPIVCGLLSAAFGKRFLAMLIDLVSYFG
jgi:hypothetical protein